MAAISYPDLGPAGVKDHFYWGFLTLVPLFHGPGVVSLDYLLKRYLRREQGGASGELAASRSR